MATSSLEAFISEFASPLSWVAASFILLAVLYMLFGAVRNVWRRIKEI